MAVYLKDPKVDRLAREVAKLAGTSITEAVGTALLERRDRLLAERAERLRRLDEHLARIRAQPPLDPRHPDELLYDAHGQPR